MERMDGEEPCLRRGMVWGGAGYTEGQGMGGTRYEDKEWGGAGHGEGIGRGMAWRGLGMGRGMT